MKKLGVIVLMALLLLPLLATPAAAWRGGWRHGHGWGAGGFFLGLGVGTLLTAPFWYRPAYAYPAYTPAYTYPAYSYPTYAYPAYTPTYAAPAYSPPPAYMPPSFTTPTPEPLAPAPQGGAEAAPPASQPPQASTQGCETVWVEGHYETRVMANGQRVTSWVPAHTQQVCQ
jgi:hypothetical protein